MITSLTITRRSNRYWTTQSNEDVSSLGSSYYSGTRKGDNLTIKTFTGGIIYPSVPYNVVHYIDTVDSANTVMTFSSGEQLEGYLIEQNFYPPIDVNSGGGSGGVDRFVELDDTFPNYIGREGMFLRVNLAGSAIEAINNPLSALRIQQLINVPDFMPKGKLLMSSMLPSISAPGFPEQSAGVIFVDPVNYINRPPLFSEGRIVRKGWTWIDNAVVMNEDNYATEVGDLLDRIFVYPADDIYPFGHVVYMPFGRWNGGDEALPTSYEFASFYGMPFMTDPDYDE